MTAARSHPPTLLKLAERCLRDEIRLPRGARVLVATSGGPDSMALLDVLAALQAPLHLSIVAHGVDHGLRAAAASELDLAEAHAEELGVPFARTKVDVPAGGDLQARTRKARHAALERARARARATFVATAHHMDDRAETVLMRILRGAGAGGLAVLPARDEKLIRPLIRARKRDVLLHLERHGVRFATDPSNADPRFLRARVRLDVMPMLESLDPSIVAHLCALADDLASAREEGSGVYRIPRAARVALATLASGKKPRATVLLPGGLIVKKGLKKGPK
ncbi:MAG TPA: tRNA lysidine(34) synthetase TilS [Polyangiaceae bacterium]|jgi:tRNA(Ile)-lysidine synthase